MPALYSSQTMAKLVTSGCLPSVSSGKTYAKALLDKSKLVKHLTTDADVHLPRGDRTILLIEDGNARFH